MPWNGKPRTPKPLFRSERCLCSDCGGACPEPVAEGNVVRCWDCLNFVETGKHAASFGWEAYCRSTHSVAAHGDPRGPCATEEEHSARLNAESAAMVDMIRSLEHAVEVGGDAKWGQTTFESLARES